MFDSLLWGAVGTTATLASYAFSPLVSTLAGSAVCFLWICLNVSTRQLIVSFLSACADIFFRQIAVVGAHKLNNDDSPLLLAIAPHANQFIDPMIVLKTLERPIGLLCAAKSMRFKRQASDIVAFFAKGLNCVPVERPQDLSRKGTGQVTFEGTAVHGAGTRFTDEVQPGESLSLTSGPGAGAVARVSEVVSDTILRLVGPFAAEAGPAPERSDEALSFKVIPKLNQKDMYTSVYDRLDANGVIGVFPEGGSHDRSNLLPLKAGIAVMALGACCEKGEQLRTRLRIVAVGLNYFSGHRFRSRVFVDYGEPFHVPKELVEQYALGGDNKRKAGDKLMVLILEAIKSVTAQAPNHEKQEILWMLRRLYAPDGSSLSLEEKVALTRGFASSCERDDDKPEVQALLARVNNYSKTLQHFAIHDRRVLLSPADESLVRRSDAAAILLVRCALVLVYCAAILPGLLLASPLLVTSEIISRAKARTAVKGSRVKLEGRDVLGTWKVLVGMIVIPILHLSYTAAAFTLVSKPFAVLYFFFMPFVSATSVVAAESLHELVCGLGPLYMLVFHRSAGTELRIERAQLQRDVRDTARKLGWSEIIKKSASSHSFHLGQEGNERR